MAPSGERGGSGWERIFFAVPWRPAERVFVGALEFPPGRVPPMGLFPLSPQPSPVRRFPPVFLQAWEFALPATARVR